MQLPSELEPFFWEYDVRKLSFAKDKKTIMAKILSSATWEGVQWLRSHVSDQEIREWILERHGRGLDPKRLRFWELILDLPHEQVNAWIDRMKRSPWETRMSS